jgi:hypothetical protein
VSAGVSIKSPTLFMTNAATLNFQVTFSETVTGVATSSFQAASTGTGTINVGGLSGSGAGPYSVTVTGMTGPGNVTISVKTSGINIKDTATNDLAAPFGLTAVVMWGKPRLRTNCLRSSLHAPSDNVQPILVGGIQIKSPTVSPTNAATLNFQALFSKIVVGVTTSSFSTSAGTIGGLSGSGAGPYSFTVFCRSLLCSLLALRLCQTTFRPRSRRVFR